MHSVSPSWQQPSRTQERTQLRLQRMPILHATSEGREDKKKNCIIGMHYKTAMESIAKYLHAMVDEIQGTKLTSGQVDQDHPIDAEAHEASEQMAGTERGKQRLVQLDIAKIPGSGERE